MAGGQGKQRQPQQALAEEPSGGSRFLNQTDPGEGSDPGVPDWRFIVAAGLIVGVALLLRLYRLDWQELWLDEAFSWRMATMPTVLYDLLIENSPPLYYLLVRGWVAVAGGSEAMLRLPSAVAGTLFVAVVLWAGREFFDTRVALWSGGVAALAPLHIYYSQEARAYAWLVLFLLLTHVLLWRALRESTWPRWALVSASALLVLYTHYLGIIGLLPSVGLLWLWPGRAQWRRYAVAMLASALGLLPWIVWSFGLTERSYTAVNWIRQVWETTPPLLAIPRSLEVFGLGSQAGLRLINLKQFSILDFPAGLRLLGLLMLGLLGLWALLPWGDGRLKVPDLRRRKTWLALFLFLPLGVLWLVSLYKPVYAPGRYDLVAYPAYPLLLGLALGKLQGVKRRGPVGAAIAALLLLLPIGSKLYWYYQAPSVGNARATAQFLRAGVSDGDVVIFTGARGRPALYYLSRLGYRVDDLECRDAQTGEKFGCRLYPRDPEVLDSAEMVRAQVQDYLKPLAADRGAVWVATESGWVSQGRLRLREQDAFLMRTLQESGLEFSPANLPLRIFRFRRS